MPAKRKQTAKQVGERCAWLTRNMLADSGDRATDAVEWYRGFMAGLDLVPDPNVEQVIVRGIAAVESAPSPYDSALASIKATLVAMPDPLEFLGQPPARR